MCSETILEYYTRGRQRTRWIQEITNRTGHKLKGLFTDFSIFFLWHHWVDIHVRIVNPKFFSLFRFCVSELCTITCIANAPLTSMLKILSDPIINQTIGSSVKLNRSSQLCIRISSFSSVYHQINKKNLKSKIFFRPSIQNLGIALKSSTQDRTY